MVPVEPVAEAEREAQVVPVELAEPEAQAEPVEPVARAEPAARAAIPEVFPDHPRDVIRHPAC